MPIWLIVVSYIVSFLGGGFLLNLLREQLHYHCVFLQMGETDPGGFSCADGISYIGAGVFIMGLLLAVAVLAIGMLASARVRLASGAGTGRALAGVSLLPLVLITGATWLATRDRGPDGAPNADYWTPAMLASALILSCAAVLVVMLCATPARWVRARRFAWLGAYSALFAATVVQPGVFVATVVSAGVLGASFLVIPAQIDSRAVVPSIPE